MIFMCSKCNRIQARWLAWYKGCGGLYSYLCDICANEAVNDAYLSKTKYPLIELRSIVEAIRTKDYTETKNIEHIPD